VIHCLHVKWIHKSELFKQAAITYQNKGPKMVASIDSHSVFIFKPFKMSAISLVDLITFFFYDSYILQLRSTINSISEENIKY
jgi:hypothetical protein